MAKKKEGNELWLVLGVALGILVLSILSYTPNNSLSTSEKILSSLPDSLDDNNILSLTQMQYEALKKEKGISEDFCIYLEDDLGNVLPIGQEEKGIGSSDILINGKPCEWQ